MGARGLLLGEGCADPYAPKPLRASMGSIYHVPVWNGPLEKELSRLKAQGFTLVCGHLKGQNTMPKVGSRCALVIGNESNGVSDSVAQMCETYRLPMYGRAESLNASIAAGILIYELSKTMRG
jgi:TrmH family RNA methyltransferase